ncbi:hypothetical protein V1477_004719 [Vespula maculifrons]|uniref:Uncharacterized protein n=1 Tax=Vespula maculifrons TaxID=7453 RepID=A0ABD2CML5_VESMC
MQLHARSMRETIKRTRAQYNYTSEIVNDLNRVYEAVDKANFIDFLMSKQITRQSMLRFIHAYNTPIVSSRDIGTPIVLNTMENILFQFDVPEIFTALCKEKNNIYRATSLI